MNYVRALHSVITPLQRQRIVSRRTVNERFGNELSLPSDYIEFLSTFGQGFFWIKMIEGPRKWSPILYVFDLVEGVPLDMIESSIDIFGEAHEVTSFFPAAYPSVPGLLAWGGSDQGDTFFWWTEGPADDWPVVVDDRLRNEIVTFQCTFTEFLYGNLTGTDHLYCGEALPGGLIYSPDEPDQDVQ